MDAIANDCRYYRNCGQYSREPYKVTYAYPDEWWGYEKRLEGEKVVIRARELEDEVKQYRQPLPPVDQSIQFNIEDDFPLEHREFIHTPPLWKMSKVVNIYYDFSGLHGLKLRTVGLLFLSVGIFYHYVKVTLNDKLLFHIHDRVDKGVYDYEDFLELVGKYRI